MWLEANPRKVRKNHYAFMRNWLSREKEKAIPSKQEVLVGSGPLSEPATVREVWSDGKLAPECDEACDWPVDHELAAAR